MKFQEFEIKDFNGIKSSSREPLFNDANDIQNFDVRNIKGDLVTRQGYIQKYSAPSNAKLTSVSTLGFKNIIMTNTSVETEVTCVVQKGTLSAESSGHTLGLPISITVPAIWTSHYWDGSNWVNSWSWANFMILTSINAITVNKYKIELDFVDSNYYSDELSGYVIVNITKSPSEVAKIIKSYSGTSSRVSLDISDNFHTWSTGDTVIIMRNYIPYDYLIGMGSATSNDVSFHKVNDDLRIGFGGYADRLGLSVGFINKYFKLSQIYTTTYTANEIEAVAKIDMISIDPYNVVGTDARLELMQVSGGTLEANTYYLKLTGVLDGFNEFLLDDAKITIDGNNNISASPRIRYGTENKRLTSLKLYWSDDNELFYFVNEWKLSDKTYTAKNLGVSSQGDLTLDAFGSINLHTDNNAVTPTTDSNATTGWTAALGLFTETTLSSISTSPTPEDGSYCLKTAFNFPDYSSFPNGIINAGLSYQITGLEEGTLYQADFWVYTTDDTTVRASLFGRRSLYRTEDNTILIPVKANTWTRAVDTLRAPADAQSLMITRPVGSNSDTLVIDNVRIAKYTLTSFITSDTDKLKEISDEMGYEPSYNLVRSWDQALVSQGKALFVNPYIEKRYANKIFFSSISGQGEFQYDVVTAANFFDLENFDGNDLIGLDILPNLDFFALKNNSVQRIDSLSGRSKEIKFGTGVISKKTIVNFGNKVLWCGKQNIYASDGLNIIDMSEGSIRDIYRKISDKTLIKGVREENYNTYRLYDGVSKEYLLMDRGWFSFSQSDTPDEYSIAANGDVWFMKNGVVYIKSDTNGDNGSAISFSWKSVPIDINLLGSQLQHTKRFYIRSYWLKYIINTSNSITKLKIGIYLDGSTSLFQQSFISDLTLGEHSDSKRLKIGTSCKYFQLEISGEDVKGEGISIASTGVLWQPQPLGRWDSNR